MARRPALLASAAVLLAALVVGAVAVALTGGSVPVNEGGRADPPTDRIGWENGYWHDDPVAADPSDGFGEAEREAVLARTMARVEVIRELEFVDPVPVEVITREAYRGRRGRGNTAAYEAWNDQIWEALFLVGEDRTVSEVLGGTLGASVQGYYSGGRIVLVSDAGSPAVDTRTLAHELVHALQDQHHTLGLGGNSGTHDRQLARRSVVEGDANVVQRRYDRRCGEAWECLPRPERTTAGADGTFDRGVFLAVFQPYATGPSFVARQHRRGGWEGVDALYDSFPVSTEQVIHPERYPDDSPETVTVADQSDERWERFTALDRPVHDTVGEASVYAAFRANGVVGDDHPAYVYDHSLSDGWAGDRIVPYRDGDRFGYVWVTAWDSPAEAREFLGGYRELLANRSARRPAADVYVVPASDPYGDAFRVRRSGNRVRIVNAPTVVALEGVGGP